MERVERILNVPIIETQVYNSELIGLFTCGNANTIIIPGIADVPKNLPKDIRVVRLASETHAEFNKYTAIGNLVLANNNGAIIASGFSKKTAQTICKALGVPVKLSTIAGLETVGSCGIATDAGVLVHPEATEDELELIEKVLKVPVGLGTLNHGTPFVGACAVANSNGVLTGFSTTPVEVTRLEGALQGMPVEE